MGGDDSLPGCIGYHPNAVFPNVCSSCAWINVCQKVVAKQRLQKLLVDVKEAKAIVRGEKI